MYAYMYDELSCRWKQALRGPTERDPIFAREFSRALRVGQVWGF